MAALRAQLPGEEIDELPAAGVPAEEMVARFARAKLIVGPHGAGLIGLIFAPADVAVVEFTLEGHSVNKPSMR